VCVQRMVCVCVCNVSLHVCATYGAWVCNVWCMCVQRMVRGCATYGVCATYGGMSRVQRIVAAQARVTEC